MEMQDASSHDLTHPNWKLTSGLLVLHVNLIASPPHVILRHYCRLLSCLNLSTVVLQRKKKVNKRFISIRGGPQSNVMIGWVKEGTNHLQELAFAAQRPEVAIEIDW